MQLFICNIDYQVTINMSAQSNPSLMERGEHARDVLPSLISNPTYVYYEKEEKLHGFLSQQFPTTANPAPLGLAAFALTTFVLSMFNAGAIVGK